MKRSKKSFLNSDRPLITVIFYPRTPGQALRTVLPSLPWCDAYCWQMDFLEGQYRTKEHIGRIIAAMGDHPCYVTNYKRSNACPGITYDTIADELLLALDCGAALIDVTGDMYDTQTYEMTYNPAAVAKQTELIAEIHRKKGEVLMSSHICEYRDTARVYEIARAHAERGADIAKIVTSAGDESQLYENLRTTIFLREHLPVKSLFLCSGSHSRLHRRIGPLLGSCIYLCRWVLEGDDVSKFLQPDIYTARALMQNAGFSDIPKPDTSR
ncbi:MAG: type I 3-dehydroquinate dehydratase [Eubacteriales bacterium]|jgi:3-dehydroquinate dehydratase|nr:type I 3-dehydroquinate dehydratase [Eubacteriales bacterium]